MDQSQEISGGLAVSIGSSGSTGKLRIGLLASNPSKHPAGMAHEAVSILAFHPQPYNDCCSEEVLSERHGSFACTGVIPLLPFRADQCLQSDSEAGRTACEPHQA